jgi:hypothetical protein
VGVSGGEGAGWYFPLGRATCAICLTCLFESIFISEGVGSFIRAKSSLPTRSHVHVIDTSLLDLTGHFRPPDPLIVMIIHIIARFRIIKLPIEFHWSCVRIGCYENYTTYYMIQLYPCLWFDCKLDFVRVTNVRHYITLQQQRTITLWHRKNFSC